MSEIVLTPEQINSIADAVVLKIQPPEPVVAPPTESQETVYLDETVKAAELKEQQLIDALPSGVVSYKGRQGTQVVNHTEESMNFINDWKRNRKSWRTRTNVR
tara:strand:- start:119 stop:427 length:309 start_codon:yes stop_codon:yes gene_type:complete